MRAIRNIAIALATILAISLALSLAIPSSTLTLTVANRCRSEIAVSISSNYGGRRAAIPIDEDRSITISPVDYSSVDYSSTEFSVRVQGAVEGTYSFTRRELFRAMGRDAPLVISEDGVEFSDPSVPAAANSRLNGGERQAHTTHAEESGTVSRYAILIEGSNCVIDFDGQRRHVIVNNKGAVFAGRHSDIATHPHQHMDVVAKRNNFNFRLVCCLGMQHGAHHHDQCAENINILH